MIVNNNSLLLIPTQSFQSMNSYPILDGNIWGANVETQFSKMKWKAKTGNCWGCCYIQICRSPFSNNHDRWSPMNRTRAVWHWWREVLRPTYNRNHCRWTAICFLQILAPCSFTLALAFGMPAFLGHSSPLNLSVLSPQWTLTKYSGLPLFTEATFQDSQQSLEITAHISVPHTEPYIHCFSLGIHTYNKV